MATLSTAFNVPFSVPAVGPFNIQCKHGTARLLRENTNGAGFVEAGIVTGADKCDNDVGGARYQFELVYQITGATAVPQADQ